MSDSIQIRPASECEYDSIAELIHESTNHWYESHGLGKIFQGAASECRLFCDVYHDLDPGQCLVAIDVATGELMGSCFVHPRETHVSLGIMNASPKFHGRGVAKRLLQEIIKLAESQGKPVRLFSSAMNLDSFSLYTRSQFAPYALFQDMILPVPEEGIESDAISTAQVREATLDDLSAIAALEKQVWGIERTSDWQYFIENIRGIWHVSVYEAADGQLTGVIGSVCHPASNMLGPGLATDDQTAAALLLAELNEHRGRSPVFLVPSNAPKLVSLMYGIGARNCELHVGQSYGPPPTINGIVLPTFMPETG